jgi:hypothetical protein
MWFLKIGEEGTVSCEVFLELTVKRMQNEHSRHLSILS